MVGVGRAGPLPVAALDARERALNNKTALLKATEKQLNEKIAEMTAIKDQLEKLLGQQSAAEEAKIVSLVKIYEGMKAKEAAGIFNTLDIDVLISIMGRMSERKSAPILAEMTPERARSPTARPKWPVSRRRRSMDDEAKWKRRFGLFMAALVVIFVLWDTHRLLASVIVTCGKPSPLPPQATDGT